MTNGKDGKPLTGPQQRAYNLLIQYGAMPPAQLARLLWPDSAAWGRRTRFHATSNQGAIGGTMPMNAAKILWRLWDKGLVTRENGMWWAR